MGNREFQSQGFNLFFPFISFFPSFVFLAGVFFFYKIKLPVFIMAVFLISVYYLIFNLYHYDGLSDCLDAFCADKSKEQRPAILKDVHVGSFSLFFGSLYVFSKAYLIYQLLDLLLNNLVIVKNQITAFFTINGSQMFLANKFDFFFRQFNKEFDQINKNFAIIFIIFFFFYFFSFFSRISAFFVAVIGKPLKNEGSGNFFISLTKQKGKTAGFFLGFLSGFLFIYLFGLIFLCTIGYPLNTLFSVNFIFLFFILYFFAFAFVLLFALIIAFLCNLFYNEKLGGITGDCFGFHIEISELLFLAAGYLMVFYFLY